MKFERVQGQMERAGHKERAGRKWGGRIMNKKV